MSKKIPPPVLLPTVGKIIRQARTARGLNLAQAACRLGFSSDDLSKLEEGLSPTTTDHLMLILAGYGGVRADAAESMLVRLMVEESRCRAHTEKRKHLSLINEQNETKPWEKIKYEEVIRGI